MVKDSSTLTKVFLILSIVAGILVALRTKSQPVSLSMTQIRVSLVITGVLALIAGVIGYCLCNLFNANDDLMISQEDNDYYEYLKGNFKFYLSFSPVITLILFATTFLLQFHINGMKMVFGIFSFGIVFFVIVPFFDMVYTIINAVRYHNN